MRRSRHASLHRWKPIGNPQQLYAQQESGISRRVQVISACLSILAMASLLVLQVTGDLNEITSEVFADRKFTTSELFLVWAAIGLILYTLTKRAQARGAGKLSP